MSPRRNGAITLDGRRLYRAGNRRVLLDALLLLVDCQDVSPEWTLVPGRRWRADLAWPAHRVAVELMGGVFTRGHHVRGVEFEHDCEKMLAASAAGWRVLPVTWRMLARNGQEVARLLDEILSCTEPAHRRPSEKTQ